MVNNITDGDILDYVFETNPDLEKKFKGIIKREAAEGARELSNKIESDEQSLIESLEREPDNKYLKFLLNYQPELHLRAPWADYFNLQIESYKLRMGSAGVINTNNYERNNQQDSRNKLGTKRTANDKREDQDEDDRRDSERIREDKANASV